ncbi:hypothetical protein GA0115259_102416 [Streptomyces sp. MnatMP-M17]|nr:hypothetical protein GA0115259_102416 [Streptomyces sp. MnatMP-M17]
MNRRPAPGSSYGSGDGRARRRQNRRVPVPAAYRESLPADDAAARPASSRATGIRNGEQET